MEDYKICSRCVMDTSDSAITFDANGECDHCADFDANVASSWDTTESGRRSVEEMVEAIRVSGKGKEFDSIIGMSGGLDSSYLLHLMVSEFGLRPLVFHVDGGWNSDLAVSNIQCVVNGLGLDLFTEVIDWEEMKDLQLAFFKAGVPHADIPQDHAFVATLYHFANKHGIKYILNGGNFSTECVRNPKEWLYYGTDLPQLFDIYNQYGSGRGLKRYPISGVLFHKLYLRYLKGVKVVKPLNSLPYTRATAIETLEETYGWRSYPQKHFESRFTKFFEGYWLPTRFGFDTRRVQYSSLILTGQMEREEAVERLKGPAYPLDEAEKDLAYVASKLEISPEELVGYLEMPLRSYKDFKNREALFDLGAKVLRMIGVEKSIKR